MKKYLYIVIWFVLCFAFAKAQNIPVNNAQELKQAIKKSQPGDTIVMKDGQWKDVNIKFKAMGTSEKPIVLRSQTPGEVKLTGSSTLRLGGDYLEVHGLWFDGGDPGDSHVIRFEADSDTPARYSRVTNCAVINVGPQQRDLTSYYVSLHGKGNRLDHCVFQGKLNKGPVVAVRLKESVDNQHQIDHNYFGERIPLGFNGGETIRIGTSQYSKQSSKTIVENNFFEKCNGEIEIISIKSANNIVRNNLILESEGTITLRHGDYNLVEGNLIIGNNNPNTGGIRMINKGNIVQNNIIIGVKGDGYRAPLCIMNGIPNAELNEYDQVIDGVMQNNTIVNSSPVSLAINTRDNATAAPENTVFANNLFYSTERNMALEVVGDISGIRIEGNIVNPTLIQDHDGVSSVQYNMEEPNGIPVPSRTDDEKLAGVTTKPKVRVDASGTFRSQIRAGAVVPGNPKPPLALTSQAGVSYLKISDLRNMDQDIQPVEVKIAPGEKTLEKAIKNSVGPTTILLEEGEYLLTKGNKLSNELTIKGAGRGKSIIKVSPNAENAPQYMFRMEGAPSLSLDNLTLVGSHQTGAVKYAISSPNGTGNVPYSLFLDQVDILDFTNTDGGAVFKAYEGTKADTISIKNSRIKNAYRGLNLSYQKDGVGKYNAEYIYLYNSSFADIEEFAINYLRTGEEPGSSGGNLLIDHCVFYRVDDSPKGRIIEVRGIQNAMIRNSVIDNSRATTSIVHLKGENQKIQHTVVYNSGRVKVSGDAQEINLDRYNPRWEDTDFFMAKEGSDLFKGGADQQEIGIIQKELKK
ncbi:polysaccharide lyase 6 family protein [Nonlabens xiamenensis]|uniref:polysaccharide lyase 6 family protein n=1 Tax=Nonlabens xiamenensis TaxID=2341043 RepID=UPI000F60C205|nr:polysaccharide lyase 6 family protein [Nonlabens xiamenensis]